MAKRILITGATGLIGRKLTTLLLSKGYSVVHLGRTAGKSNVAAFRWSPHHGTIDTACLDQVDTIVHLAGAGVADKRWTASRKKEILDSRVQSTELLYKTLTSHAHSVRTLVSASAIGYYGFESGNILTEEDSVGSDFLAMVTQRWEKATDNFATLGIRTTKIRIGIVLSNEGGALTEIARPIRWGLGAPLGSGRQQLSWIHIGDLGALFLKAIEDNQMNGAYNAAAAWCSNAEMTRAVAKLLRRPLWLPPIPSLVLRIILGEMADIILKGSKISSEKIKRTGFQFQFADLDSALNDIFQRSREVRWVSQS